MIKFCATCKLVKGRELSAVQSLLFEILDFKLLAVPSILNLLNSNRCFLSSGLCSTCYSWKILPKKCCTGMPISAYICSQPDKISLTESSNRVTHWIWLLNKNECRERQLHAMWLCTHKWKGLVANTSWIVIKPKQVLSRKMQNWERNFGISA